VAEVLRFTIPVFAIGALGMAVGSRTASAATRRARWLKFIVYVVVVHAVLASAWAGPRVAAGLVGLIGMLGAAELSRATRAVGKPAGRWLVAIVYAALVAGAVRFVLVSSAGMVTFAYLVVAAFDGFSQVGGQIAGRRRLAASISPGKTVEGSACGAAAAVLVAWLLRGFPGLELAPAAAWALLVAVSGLSGDLAASWVKRRAGVKDFGRILPGHGGVLDRFDSLLASATAVWAVQALVRAWPS
jgi:phosphatidate cytidylyltransferase